MASESTHARNCQPTESVAYPGGCSNTPLSVQLINYSLLIRFTALVHCAGPGLQRAATNYMRIFTSLADYIIKGARFRCTFLTTDSMG